MVAVVVVVVIVVIHFTSRRWPLGFAVVVVVDARLLRAGLQARRRVSSRARAFRDPGAEQGGEDMKDGPRP